MAKEEQAQRQRKMLWLRRFRQLDSEVRLCCEEIQFWQEKGAQLVSCYDLKVRGGAHRDMGDVAARIMDMQMQLYHKMMRLLLLQKEIQGAIERIVDPRLRHLLELRYVQGLTLEAVAERMEYSWRQVQRLHAQALDGLEIQ